MGYIFATLFKDLAKARRIIIWVLIAAVLFAMSWVFTQTFGEGQSKEETYGLLAWLLSFKVLPLASALFTSSILSQEVEQKTIVYLLSRPVPRWKLYLSRLAASAMLVTLIAWVAALGVSAAVYGFAFWHNPEIWTDLIALAVGAVAYGALFGLVSLFVHRSMILNLLFAFGWETSVPSIPGDLNLFTVSSYLTAIAGHQGVNPAVDLMGAASTPVGTPLSTQTAWIVIAGIIAVTVGFSLLWFNRFEYVPREDAA